MGAIKIKTWLIVLISIFVVLLLVAGVTGFVPGVSDIMGTNKPRDLGVEFTKEDYVNAMNKADFKLDSSEGLGPNTKISYSGQKEIDTTFSQEEISALLSYDHAERYPAKDAQVKIHEDGTVEASAKVKIEDYKGVSINNAVYLKGDAELVAPNTVKITNVDKAEIGRVPAPITDDVINQVENEINERLNKIPGLRIESISVEEGAAGIKGTIPESATRIPV